MDLKNRATDKTPSRLSNGRSSCSSCISVSRTRTRSVSTSSSKQALSNKMKRNKRDGTPDKMVSPNNSQSQMEEDQILPSKQIINGEDIQALAIDLSQLQKLRAPRPPSGDKAKTEATRKVIVRKMKSKMELDAPKMKTMTIAKPATPNAPLMADDYSGCSGPRFDTTGKIIPHSILGTVDDFKYEAMIRGHMKSPDNLEAPSRPQTPKVKFEKPQKVTTPRDAFLNENNALRNWQMKMLERKRTQGYISKLLQRPADTLVMNQAKEYRETQEQRYQLDRAIPAVQYGKGYRVGSEFWKQQERIGDDLSGIHMTLTQTERGYPPPVEHIGHPDTVQKEMGVQLEGVRSSTPVNYPWKKSTYFKDWKNKLRDVMIDLDEFKPDIDNLQVIGRSKSTLMAEREDQELLKEGSLPATLPENQENIDPLAGQPDLEEQFIGPSLQFNGFKARWAGDSHSMKGQLACSARVTFEAFSGVRNTSHLYLVNDGTTTIYYNWKKIPKVNPFEGCATPKIQRFYFNTSSGVLLPGDSLKFPFVFKSPNAGIFTEKWHLETKPTVCNGADLEVILRGVALQEDKNKKARNELERELLHKQAEANVRMIVDELVAGVRTPDRARSPVDAYITDEEVFERQNLGMHFSNDVVNQLKQVYLEQFPEEEREGVSWDLSVSNMKKELLALEDEDLREELLNKMNMAVTSLYFPPFTPAQTKMYKVGYNLISETIDKMVTNAMILRNMLGMAEKEETMPETDQILAANENLRGIGEKKKKKDNKEEEKKDGKKDNKKAKGKDKEDKDKDRPKSKNKGKSRMASSPTPTRERKPPQAKAPAIPKDMSPVSCGDPVLDAKFRSKLYVQMYGFLGDMMEKMVGMFEDIKMEEDQIILNALS
ncbi:MYCBP-associated protein-like isoform X2 [Anneissia japonica]|uniref:MYCBP-associated protein-like isoform X2 n=1 Tax=Anneissia japonica TaxID=1529436 RepID=UPI0014258884|nr:MYCBP-associated protein-like isoform X2 [Anneissia japonica]